MTLILNKKANVSAWEGTLREGNHAETSPLVYITKLPSTLDDEMRQLRIQRYALQSLVKDLLPYERVSICLRNRISKDKEVEVWKHKDSQKCFYAGLLVCGSVWLCPVCAAKISERRRNELFNAGIKHQENGGHLMMMTLTFSHKKKDKLSTLLEKLNKATLKFRSGRAYNNLRDQIKLIGSIRAFEVTYGENGFHPHIHLLLFCEKFITKVEMEFLKTQFFNLWEKACNHYGLQTTKKYGLDLQDGSEAMKYVTKWGEEGEPIEFSNNRNWGIDREMTKLHMKKSKRGVTPWEMLKIIMENEQSEYIPIFKEYAKSIKGKTQLYWSKNLKKKFLIDEKSDEQLAKEKLEEADLLGDIPFYIWSKILRLNKRAEFTNICEDTSLQQAIIYIQNLYDKKNINKKAPQSND